MVLCFKETQTLRDRLCLGCGGLLQQPLARLGGWGGK